MKIKLISGHHNKKKTDVKKYYNAYYNIETVENPNTHPDILRKILERGNDDDVSCYAAQNPNCLEDALRMVLARGKDDRVS